MYYFNKVLFLVVYVLFNKVWTQTVPEYTVAVVEYHPLTDRNIPPEIRISRNVGAYETIISDLSESMSLDLVVFPEGTLTANGRIASHTDLFDYSVEVPDVSSETSPCYNSDEFPAYFSLLSCNALYYKTYIAVNLLERARCNATAAGNCAGDNWDYYNTNVVFDRNGTIIGRYRKYHLFGEFLLNQTATPDISIVETDLGLKFGIFTCFDILFSKPALDLYREHGIRHFIYPSMWFSELPFLISLQAQQQWAEELDVVLLASGANNPGVGSGGTGIYQGKSGAVISDILPTATTKVYTAKLSENTTAPNIRSEDDIDRLAKELDNFYLLKDDLRRYTARLIEPERSQITTAVCNGKDANQLCCNFSIKTTLNRPIYDDKTKDQYRYYMVAYSGVRTVEGSKKI